MTKREVTAYNSKNYTYFLDEIKQEINKARIIAARTVNKELIALYWNIGKMIIHQQEKHGWGKSIVERLSVDLASSYGSSKGYSAQNLWYMRQFYYEYKGNRKLQQLVGEIPWGHNILILSKVKNIDEREYYIKASSKLGWSRNVLLNQIKANAYEVYKKIPKQHNFPAVLPAHLAEQADESIKSVSNLDFLGIARPILEKELEKRLIEKIKQFILELGYGFTFIGNQYRLQISDKEYFIDLLFFNRKLKSLVAIELKTGEFKPEYAGKMDFYLHLLDEKVKLEDENPSIGIILCAKKDNIIVEYALKSAKKSVGVAEYYLTKRLPKELKGKLPDAKKIKETLKHELAREDEYEPGKTI